MKYGFSIPLPQKGNLDQGQTDFEIGKARKGRKQNTASNAPCFLSGLSPLILIIAICFPQKSTHGQQGEETEPRGPTRKMEGRRRETKKRNIGGFSRSLTRHNVISADVISLSSPGEASMSRDRVTQRITTIGMGLNWPGPSGQRVILLTLRAFVDSGTILD